MASYTSWQATHVHVRCYIACGEGPYTFIQWNPSNPNTIGSEESVLIREVSLFQGLKSTQTWYILGEEECVLFREVSLFQGCPYRGVPMASRLFQNYVFFSAIQARKSVSPKSRKWAERPIRRSISNVEWQHQAHSMFDIEHRMAAFELGTASHARAFSQRSRGSRVICA